MTVDQILDAPSTTSTSSGGSGGRGKLFLVGFIVLGVLVTGVVFKDQIPGLQPEPAPALPDSAFTVYEQFWNGNREGIPPELSIERIKKLGDDCIRGGLPRNVPQYLDADELGRARGGYECLMGLQETIETNPYPAPGTETWRRSRNLPRVQQTVHGHIIGKSLRGRGDETRNGQCVNMVVQSSTPNGQMGNQAERIVKGLAEAAGNEQTPIFYVVVPVYTGRNYMPTSMNPFAFSTVRTGRLGPPTGFLNEVGHISQVGVAP